MRKYILARSTALLLVFFGLASFAKAGEIAVVYRSIYSDYSMAVSVIPVPNTSFTVTQTAPEETTLSGVPSGVKCFFLFWTYQGTVSYQAKQDIVVGKNEKVTAVAWYQCYDPNYCIENPGECRKHPPYHLTVRGINTATGSVIDLSHSLLASTTPPDFAVQCASTPCNVPGEVVLSSLSSVKAVANYPDGATTWSFLRWQLDGVDAPSGLDLQLPAAPWSSNHNALAFFGPAQITWVPPDLCRQFRPICDELWPVDLCKFIPRLCDGPDLDPPFIGIGPGGGVIDPICRLIRAEEFGGGIRNCPGCEDFGLDAQCGHQFVFEGAFGHDILLIDKRDGSVFDMALPGPGGQKIAYFGPRRMHDLKTLENVVVLALPRDGARVEELTIFKTSYRPISAAELAGRVGRPIDASISVNPSRR